MYERLQTRDTVVWVDGLRFTRTGRMLSARGKVPRKFAAILLQPRASERILFRCRRAADNR